MKISIFFLFCFGYIRFSIEDDKNVHLNYFSCRGFFVGTNKTGW